MALKRGVTGEDGRERYDVAVPPIVPGSTVRVRADRSDPSWNGSLEHYWHYLFGFLLPLAYALHSEPRLCSDATLVVPSCGPLMDQRTTDLLDAFGCAATIEPIADGTRPPRSRVRRAVSRLGRGPRSGRRSVRDAADPTVHLPRWDVALREPGASGVGQSLRDSVAAVLARASGCAAARETEPPGRYLLLVRSASHPFYEPGGGAEKLGYGTGRRVLHGHDECLDALDRAGVPAAVYEPGAHSLTCQARTFAEARGFVAIRGAELANMVWMTPDSLPLMINTATQYQPPPQRAVAAALGLRHYLEIAPTASGPVVLDPDVVVPLLVDHFAGRSPTTAG